MNWLFSAIIYLLCIAGILVSLIRHAIPHLGLVWRWVLGSAGVLFFGWLGGVGTLKQYRVEHPNKPDIDLTIDSMIASFPISSEVDHQRFQVFVIIFNRGSPAKLHGWNLDLKSDAVVFSAHQVFNQEPIGGRMKFPAVDELSSKPLDHGEQVTRCAYFVIQGLTQGRLDAMKGDPSAVLIISVLDEGETKYIAKKSVMELINQGVEHFKSP